MKKILIVINYYFPYISGVSESARLVAEKMVKEGNEVTVLTSNHAGLKKRDKINGVNVIRAKVLFKISKGTVSPQFVFKAIKICKNYDVVNLHLPMMESGMIASLLSNKNIITTYHCDVNLPKTIINNFIVKLLDISSNLCLKKSRKIIVTSLDYCRHSRVANKFEYKACEISEPIKDYYPIKVKKNSDKKVIGFCGRIVEEKGIDVLIKAYQLLKKRKNNIFLKIGGDYEHIAGGSVYLELKDYIEKNNITDIEFVGKISEHKMEEFYSSLDVMALPSTNSLEAFGMVQVEAMLCGTPVVASDLPGVRTIIPNTGMGEVCRRNDVADLADKLELVLDHPERYTQKRGEIEKIYGINKIYESYYKAFFTN